MHCSSHFPPTFNCFLHFAEIPPLEILTLLLKIHPQTSEKWGSCWKILKQKWQIRCFSIWFHLFSYLLDFFGNLNLKQLVKSQKLNGDTKDLKDSKLESFWAFICPKMVKKSLLKSGVWMGQLRVWHPHFSYSNSFKFKISIFCWLV